jgi:predicted molibdopterin-dependent oxidoreductase YjgC
MTKPTSARLPLDANIARGKQLQVELNGKLVTGYEGETVAALFAAENLSALRTTQDGEARGMFCGMGVCFDCLVVINGIPNTRACMTWLKEGMKIASQTGLTASE